MHFKTRSGRNLYYETKKGNSGKTVVLLNGLTQSTLAWSLMELHLSGHNLLLLDFIFQGRSDKNGEWQTFDQHATDVADLLAVLNINNPCLVGISYGSLVAQHIAVLYPEKVEKLILISSFCFKTPYYQAIETAWENALKIGGYELLLDVMLPSVLSENYFTSPLIPIELMKQARKDLNQDSTAILKLMQATKARGDYRKQLNEVKAPTLVIHGEKDLLFPAHMGKEVVKNIKNSEFFVVKKFGHTLNLEAPELTASLINKFI